jgi:hypothetical protein
MGGKAFGSLRLSVRVMVRVWVAQPVCAHVTLGTCRHLMFFYGRRDGTFLELGAYTGLLYSNMWVPLVLEPCFTPRCLLCFALLCFHRISK